MSSYRRNREGRIFFFTVVTNLRRPILTTDQGRAFLRDSIDQVKYEFPFEVVAFVLLPDHLHTVWEMPIGDSDYSGRWQRIKATFTKQWRRDGGELSPISDSRTNRGEQGVWQRRFFEHTCRDDTDLKRSIDYVHVNPLKHHLVSRVSDWPWSTFHRFVKQGGIRDGLGKR